MMYMQQLTVQLLAIHVYSWAYISMHLSNSSVGRPLADLSKIVLITTKKLQGTYVNAALHTV